MTSWISDNFKTQELCDKEVEKYPWSSVEVSDHFKTQEMCNKAVEKDLFLLMNLPDGFKNKTDALKQLRNIH